MCSKKHQKEAMNILQDMASMPNETDVSKLTKKIVFDGSNLSDEEVLDRCIALTKNSIWSK